MKLLLYDTLPLYWFFFFFVSFLPLVPKDNVASQFTGHGIYATNLLADWIPRSRINGGTLGNQGGTTTLILIDLYETSDRLIIV